MSSTAGLNVAIHDGEGAYKHWRLYIDGPTDEEQTILHIMGSSTRYRFEMRTSDVRKSVTLSELIHLCDVPVSRLGAIKEAAASAPIHNEFAGYNCQDYVIDLLEDLERKGIIDGRDPDYKKSKKAVKSKQEGFA